MTPKRVAIFDRWTAGMRPSGEEEAMKLRRNIKEVGGSRACFAFLK
jgi:hypothetical protein